MHQQIRVVPAASPSDLAKLLGVLATEKVNLVAAGGGNIELGEEFAFATTDGQEQTAMEALAKDYHPRLLKEEDGDFKLCWLTNEPGQLLSCIKQATEENLDRGRKVKDILIGVERENGLIGVQVYSVDDVSSEDAVQA
jgi:hypothetical protein